MRLNISSVILFLLGSKISFTKAQETAITCELPQGSYAKSCKNINLLECTTDKSMTDLLCKLSAECQPNNPELKPHLNEILFTPGEKSTLTNVDGVIQGSKFDTKTTRVLLAAYSNCKKLELPKATSNSTTNVEAKAAQYNQGFIWGSYLMMQLRGM